MRSDKLYSHDDKSWPGKAEYVNPHRIRKTISEFTKEEINNLLREMNPTEEDLEEHKKRFIKTHDREPNEEDIEIWLEISTSYAYMDLYSCDSCTSTLTNDGTNLWCDYHRCFNKGLIISQKLYESNK